MHSEDQHWCGPGHSCGEHTSLRWGQSSGCDLGAVSSSAVAVLASGRLRKQTAVGEGPRNSKAQKQTATREQPNGVDLDTQHTAVGETPDQGSEHSGTIQRTTQQLSFTLAPPLVLPSAVATPPKTDTTFPSLLGTFPRSPRKRRRLRPPEPAASAQIRLAW